MESCLMRMLLETWSLLLLLLFLFLSNVFYCFARFVLQATARLHKTTNPPELPLSVDNKTLTQKQLPTRARISSSSFSSGQAS